MNEVDAMESGQHTKSINLLKTFLFNALDLRLLEKAFLILALDASSSTSNESSEDKEEAFITK